MRDWIRDLTDFVFLQDDPAPADILFIAGNAHAEPAERAAGIYLAGYAPLVLPSGRYAAAASGFPGQQSGARRYSGRFESEWAFMRRVLMENGVPSEAILREDRARFTYQNAIASRARTEAAALTIRRAILCCMPVHARRSFMYYSALFPEAEILVCPAGGCELTRDNWTDSEQGIAAVLGEVERCGSQFHDILTEKLLHPAGGFPSPLEQRWMPEGAAPADSSDRDQQP